MDMTSSGIEKLLLKLNKQSVSADEVKSALKELMIFSCENKDVVYEMVDNGSVETLVKFFNTDDGRPFRGQIACILILLCFKSKGGDDYASDIALTAISNMLSGQDLNRFIQLVTGIKDIATNSSQSSPSPLPPTYTASTESALPATHFLSVPSSSLLLEKASALLTEPLSKISEQQKLSMFYTLLELISTGVMNEAAEYVGLLQSQGSRRSGGESGGGGKSESESGSGVGGGESGSGCGSGDSSEKNDQPIIPSVRFSKAFADFAEAVKGIMSSSRKGSALWCEADSIYRLIEENSFFPTSFPLNILCLDFPLRFLPNSAAHVANSGNRLLWNSQGWSSFLVEPELREGLYRMDVEGHGNGSYMGVGVASKGVESLAADQLNTPGGCVIWPSPGGIHSGNNALQNYDKKFYSPSEKVSLGLELDANRHILYFFVKGKQVGHYMTSIPPSVRFGVSGYNKGCWIELKMVRKLTALSTVPALAVTPLQWK